MSKISSSFFALAGLSAADLARATEIEAETERLLAQANQHSPEQAKERVRAARKAHHSNPTSESLACLVQAENAPAYLLRFDEIAPSSTKKLLRAGYEVVWSYYRKAALPLVIEILQRDLHALTSELEAQKQREEQWLPVLAEWQAQANRYGDTVELKATPAEQLEKRISALKGAISRVAAFDREDTYPLQRPPLIATLIAMGKDLGSADGKEGGNAAAAEEAGPSLPRPT